MVRKTLFSVLAMLLTSTSLLAQNGSIKGIVQDGNGLAISAANVTVASPSLIGGSSATFTDRDGHYRFPYLASGTYEVRVELKGFQTLIRKEVDLSAGQTLTVDFTLEVTSVSEVVEVTEKPPLIDLRTTAISFTIPPEIIQNLPRLEDIKFLMSLTPGVSDDLVAFGAEGEKANAYWIDGVSVGSPPKGNLAVKYNYNWIDEVQVTGIGATAEYGGFTGVVGNFITRSGGNQFHGLFETFFQNEDLTSSNIPDPGPEIPFKTYDVSAQIGGPIVRDRIWFFSGFQFPYTQTPTPGTDQVTTDEYTKFITKLTYKLNQNNTLQGFANWNGHTFEIAGSRPRRTPEANYMKNESPQWSWNATWISLLSSETTLEGRFGGFHQHSKDIEENPELASHSDFGTGITSVNNSGRYDAVQAHVQANAAVSYHARDFIRGSHDFRFGIEFERSDLMNEYRINGDVYYYDLFGSPYLRRLGFGYIFDAPARRVSSYAQDEWNISDRFNLSLGVRWDHNRGSTLRGTVFKTDPVSPRIGFVWILNQENQTVIKAHYGDYYDALLSRYYFFLSDDFEPAIYEQYIDGQWVEQFRDFPRIPDSEQELKQPYVRQFTIGIDRVLPGNIPFGAHYIYRRWANLLETVANAEYEPVPFVSPITGETITIYNLLSDEIEHVLMNPPGAQRRYDGVEIYGSKQFANRLSLSGSLVYSKLTGNFFSNLRGSGGSNTRFLDDPNSQVNRQGRNEVDRTISWKIVGIYALPWAINTGFYFRHESGDTWTALVFVEGLNQGGIVIFGEEAGSRRFPSRNILDMRVEKEFPMYGGQLRFTADIFNVLNSAYAIDVNRFFGTPDFGVEDTYNLPRQIRLGLRYTF